MGKISYPFLVPDWGVGPEEGRPCAIEVRMVAEGGAILKKPVSLAWGKEGISCVEMGGWEKGKGGRQTLSDSKVWAGKAPGLSQMLALI